MSEQPGSSKNIQKGGSKSSKSGNKGFRKLAHQTGGANPYVTSKDIIASIQEDEVSEGVIPVVPPKAIIPTIVEKKASTNDKINDRMERRSPFVTNGEKEVYQKKQKEKSNPDDYKYKGAINPKKVAAAPDMSNPSSFEQKPYVVSAKGKPGEQSFEFKTWNEKLISEAPVGEYPLQAVKFNPTLQQLFNPTSIPTTGPNVQLPIQNVYQITLPGPTGGHVEMNQIYETVLPGKDIKLTFTTLGERINVLEYLRQIFVKINDGEDIGLEGDSKRNLLSFVKLMEMNPNYYSPLFNNPYKGLPLGLIVYRAGFPIRFDPISQSVVCAREAIGLNIRLYALNVAEYCSYLQRDINYKQYDVWRELAYYEYVRETIVKQRKSPNFVTLYAFFLCPNGKINYFALKSKLLSQKDLMTSDYQLFRANFMRKQLAAKATSEKELLAKTLTEMEKKLANKTPEEIQAAITDAAVKQAAEKVIVDELKQSSIRFEDTDGETVIIDRYHPALMKPNCEKPLGIEPKCDTNGKLPDEVDPTLQYYSGVTLLLLTEAPTHNLYQWISRSYQKDGIVSKMVSHGFYSADIWYSVLFQIVSALYVMQTECLYLRDMTIEDNINIKDLQSGVGGGVVGYWKYIVDGIPYYVPNYGYLAMIDTNFKDIKPGRSLGGFDLKRQYKFCSSGVIGDSYPVDEIRLNIWKNYRSIINTNAFTKEHTLNCVNKPPEEIMQFIEELMLDQETDIGKVIFKHFTMFMNNRVGTYLRSDFEVPNLVDGFAKLREGEMVAEIVHNNAYRWAIYTGVDEKDPGVVHILTRDRPDSKHIISRSVRIETLKQYAPYEPIKQNYAGERSKLSESELLETYTISKLSIPRL